MIGTVPHRASSTGREELSFLPAVRSWMPGAARLQKRREEGH